MARKAKNTPAEEPSAPLANPEMIRDELVAQTMLLFDLELELADFSAPIKAKMKKAKNRQKELMRELRKSGAAHLSEMVDDDEGETVS